MYVCLSMYKKFMFTYTRELQNEKIFDWCGATRALKNFHTRVLPVGPFRPSELLAVPLSWQFKCQYHFFCRYHIFLYVHWYPSTTSVTSGASPICVGINLHSLFQVKRQTLHFLLLTFFSFFDRSPLDL